MSGLWASDYDSQETGGEKYQTGKEAGSDLMPHTLDTLSVWMSGNRKEEEWIIF